MRPTSRETDDQRVLVTFTRPLTRSLELVAIVIVGLMFMFGEGGAKAPGRIEASRARHLENAATFSSAKSL